MSSYFFHLKLELYDKPATAAARKRRKTAHTTEDPDDDGLSHTGRINGTARRAFVPPSGTDIFKSSLPAHRTSRWTSYTFARRRPSSDTGSTTPVNRISLDQSDSPRPRQQQLSPETDRKDAHGDALLLPERSLNLRKDHLPLPSSSRLRVVEKLYSNEAAERDWRYETVEIESIDMEKSKASGTAGGGGGGRGGLHTTAVYLPSDPKTTDVGWGVVHLYRDREESQFLDGDAPPRKSVGGTASKNLGGKADEDNFSVDDCTTLCILAVPSWMMPSDLLGFVGDQAREDVSHFRLIRTGRANKYMVLLKFRAAKKAREWQKMYNGRLFSAAEPENCHVVFVKSVEFLSPDADMNATSFPHNINDPFTAGNGANKSMLAKPMAPPPPNLRELPTCPVCLERMDETTGLLTILCQHVFHCACLEKWRGSGCPVCRYTHSPSYTFPYPRPGGNAADDLEEAEPMCSGCAGTTNLWICLICGSIGCGRYDSAHAYAHYEETSHCYAMDIQTQHVWDYAGDGYVHRLIQSKPPPTPAARDDSSAAGGMLDMPIRRRHENEAYRAEGGDVVPREKMESMANEYTYLLTSQLEGQRRYFEEQVERAVDKASQASQRAEEAATFASKSAAQLESATRERAEMKSQLTRIEKSFEKAEATKKKFEHMARDMSNQLREEKMLNEGLLKRIRAAEEQAKEAKVEAEKAKDEKKELEDMNHDLTMFISSQEKVRELEAQGEEVVDGSAFAPEQSSSGGGKKKGKGMKK